MVRFTMVRFKKDGEEGSKGNEKKKLSKYMSSSSCDEECKFSLFPHEMFPAFWLHGMIGIWSQAAQFDTGVYYVFRMLGESPFVTEFKANLKTPLLHSKSGCITSN